VSNAGSNAGSNAASIAVSAASIQTKQSLGIKAPSRPPPRNIRLSPRNAGSLVELATLHSEMTIAIGTGATVTAAIPQTSLSELTTGAAAGPTVTTAIVHSVRSLSETIHSRMPANVTTAGSQILTKRNRCAAGCDHLLAKTSVQRGVHIIFTNFILTTFT